MYVIKVTWSDGSCVTVYRRYSAFFDFHTRLLDEFPIDAGVTFDGMAESRRVIPFLPGKCVCVCEGERVRVRERE